MRRVENRRIRRTRKAQARSRRKIQLAAAALAAGGFGLAGGDASAAPVGWTVGEGSGFYDADELGYGVGLDIDGDGETDFSLSLGYGGYGGYGGGALLLTPETVNAINNEVYTAAAFDTVVVEYADPADILTSADDTTAAPGSATLWDMDFYTGFEDGGFAGLIFEIPGGSPYHGYLDITVNSDFTLESIEINETAFRAVPEVGTGVLMLSALGFGALGLPGLGRRVRRKADA